jgi:hypothetical protein
MCRSASHVWATSSSRRFTSVTVPSVATVSVDEVPVVSLSGMSLGTSVLSTISARPRVAPATVRATTNAAAIVCLIRVLMSLPPLHPPPRERVRQCSIEV